MKAMKRMLTILLAVATVFAFTPFVGDWADSYAGNGTKYNQKWVDESIEGIHSGYAIAGCEITGDP